MRKLIPHLDSQPWFTLIGGASVWNPELDTQIHVDDTANLSVSKTRWGKDSEAR